MATIQAIGQSLTTTKVNVRLTTPSIASPVLRKLDPGIRLILGAAVTGQAIEGNDQWYPLVDGGFIWSGGCAPLMPLSTGGGISTLPNVVDISHGDAVTDFQAARNAGLIGIIHKATTGATGQDPDYANRRQAAEAAGFLWGAYHWGTAAPVDQQLANFLTAANPGPDTLVALDFESDLGDQMTLDLARQFLQGIQDRLGRRAVLYSGNVIKTALGSSKDAFFGEHRLWLCQYGPKPVVQASWSTFWLWQYTDGTDTPTPQKIPGIPGDDLGRLDCNHYMGSEEDLRSQWAG